jgi:hypothetical protein
MRRSIRHSKRVSAAAKLEQPEFLQRLQTCVLYVLFVLYFETEVDLVDADRLVVGIVQLLHKSGVFYHPILHEVSMARTIARITQEG